MQLFDVLPVPSWIYDTRTLRIVAVNAAALQKYGYSRGEFLAMTLVELRPPELVDELKHHLARLNETDTGLLTAHHVLADGRLIDVEVIGNALGADLPHLRVVLAQDATKRRQAERQRDRTEEELRMLNERLTTTLESITDAFFTVDREGRFTYVNRRAEEAFGIDRTGLLGRSSWPLLRQARGVVDRTEFELAMRENDSMHFTDFFPGFDRWLEVHIYPSEVGLAVYFRDVTDTRRAAEVKAARVQAETSSRLKTEFMSRLSHEMRTPLNAMLGFAQLLSLQYTNGRRADDRTQLGYASHILSAGRHLLALVNDLLDVQQMGEGRLAMHPVPLDLAGSVAGAIAFMAPLAATRGIAVSSSVASGVRVTADEVRLRQVLLNLASNAIKYNRVGGTVQWTTEAAPAGFVTLVITDEGPGISAADQAALFQPFQRLGREASAIEGTGLGLVVSRGLVEQMGGTLRIDSEPGRGTRAIVELPRAVGTAAIQLDAAAPAMAIHENGASAPAVRRRVLYVEDNPLNAVLFEAAIGARSHVDLRIADSGAKCLQLISEWQPELLALDANLPDTDGFELLTRLRAMPGLERTPAFMCSASALPEDIERAQRAGFAGYWTKPVDVRQVLADIDAALATNEEGNR